VEKIRSTDEEAMKDLYGLFARGIRFQICRMLGPQDLEDKVHDTFVIVVQAIVNGDLREADRLPGFIRTVVRRQVAGFIDKLIQTRQDHINLDNGMKIVDERQNPEEAAIFDEQVEIMKEVLRGINLRDREILTRYYIQDHPAEEICADLGLTDTQFRLLKSRAKARFGEIGRKRVVQRTLTKIFMRKKAGGRHL
jgi:RNA polymerase sigma factor (sigma-70 family)